MMTEKTASIRSKVGRIVRVVAVLVAGNATCPAVAEDWGAFSIVPASAPALVLEAVGSGKDEGAVSIGKPTGAANQKWVITPRGNDLYSIRPSSGPNLVLAASQGGSKLGTPIVLEIDGGQPWQAWRLDKNEDGSYCVVPKHAPDRGLDHLGGKPSPGAQIDLWTNAPGDQHLRWQIRPLAGSPSPQAGGAGESPPLVHRAGD